MNFNNVFDSDFSNQKFRKEKIYKGYLCDLIITEGYLQVIVDDEIVGFMNDDLFLDFSSGNVFSVLNIDNNTKNNSPGKYVVYPARLYEKKGSIIPGDVLCDFESEKNGVKVVESKSKNKILKRVLNKK